MAINFSEAGIQASIAIDAGDVWIRSTTPAPTFSNANGWSKRVIGRQSVSMDPSGVMHTAGAAGFISALASTSAPARMPRVSVTY
jgi:hypothetical protein